jgi:putative transposase
MDQYANNRAEQSHEAARVRQCGMRKLKSTSQAQGCVRVHAAVHNLVNWSLYPVRAEQCRNLSMGAFNELRRTAA